MAAPSHTTRQDPAGGIRMDDGYRSLIAFAADPDVCFWEKGVTPPGIDGGDAIPTTTMHNDTLRSFDVQSLKTLTDCTARVAYNPAVYPQILALCNVKTEVTVHFPNGGRISFWGALRTFEPDELVEGQQPEATITVTPLNVDDSGNEQNFVHGTGSW